jgi:macrolide-specific efflux system membrane fusion protein
MKTISTYIRQHRFVSGSMLVVLIAGVILAARSKSVVANVRYVTQTVAVQTLTNTITETGQIAASNEVDIKPSSTANVTSVRVKQGDSVKAGDILLTLDNTNEAQQVSQAKASLDSAEASYQNLLAGLDSNNLQLAQISVQQAQQSLTDAQTNLQTVTTQQATDVANAQTTLLNSNLQAIPDNTLSTGTVTLSGSYSGTQQGEYDITIYESGNGLTYSVSGLGNESGVITQGLPQPLGNGLYITFSSAGTFSTTTSYKILVPNVMGTNYQNNLTAYNTAVQNQATAIQNANQQVTSAQTAMQSAQVSYNEKTAPPTASQVASSQAQVSQAQANYNTAVTAYDNTIIKAPIDGTVAAVNVSVGDQANEATSSGSSSTDLVTIITPQQVAEISLNEVDAAKLQVGQKATLTFNAISGLTLTGTVVEIDTVGTVTQGVATYGAKIALDVDNDQVKPGMTTNVNIITSVDQNVIAVPTTAVKSDSNGSYVQVLGSDGKPQDVSVVTGDTTNTETVITSGLSAGDKVVTQTINTAAKTTATTASTSSLLGGSTARTVGAGARAGGFSGGGGFGGGAAGGL